MKKWNNYLLKVLCLLLVSVQAIGQTETFDIATYTPPKAWKKDSKDGVVNYTHVNAANGGFCVINIYVSITSTGDAKKNFIKGWKDLVVTPFKAEANPKTETQTTDDGWKVISAAAPIKLDGADVIVMLSVITGFGKTMNVRASLNDETYTADIDALFQTMELNKTKTATVTTTTNTVKEHPISNASKFGMMLYTPPTGWSHDVYSDGVVFKPLDIPAGEYLGVQIIQPINSPGTLEQALAKSFDEAAAMYNGTTMNYAGSGAKYKKTEAKRSFNGWDYMTADGGVRIGAGEYPPEYGLVLFVIKINNRFERIAILKTRTTNRSCSMSSYYPDERQQYKSAIDNFLLSIQFTDGQEPELKRGSTDGGGIQGVWQGISMNASSPSTSQPVGLGYKVFSPIFLSNGQAYFGPKFYSDGLDGVDTRILAELHRRDWGTYTFNNGRGILKMPYGDIPLRMEGNILIITANNTNHRFHQLPSVDGARFNGIYVMAEAFGKVPSITFTADGKFNDDGAVRVLYHEYTDCLNPALKPGSGTYEVKDYTIIFNYTDGRKIRIAFLGTEYDIKNQSPSILRMSANEDPLTKK